MPFSHHVVYKTSVSEFISNEYDKFNKFQSKFIRTIAIFSKLFGPCQNRSNNFFLIYFLDQTRRMTKSFAKSSLELKYPSFCYESTVTEQSLRECRSIKTYSEWRQRPWRRQQRLWQRHKSFLWSLWINVLEVEFG